MLEGVVIDDTELFNDRLQAWEDFYNFYRPHGGLGARPRLRGEAEDREPGVSEHRQSHTAEGTARQSNVRLPAEAPNAGPRSRVTLSVGV